MSGVVGTPFGLAEQRHSGRNNRGSRPGAPAPRGRMQVAKGLAVLGTGHTSDRFGQGVDNPHGPARQRKRCCERLAQGQRPDQARNLPFPRAAHGLTAGPCLCLPPRPAESSCVPVGHLLP